jgi:putative intracellular protease/amidase
MTHTGTKFAHGHPARRSGWRLAVLLLFCLPLALGLAPGAAAGAETAKHYVCPPCGLPCDKLVYEKPGACPTCGMALVDQDSVAADASAHPKKKVALLIFTGVQIIDYTGPYEVFGVAGFDVYTVAESKDAITTAMGMAVLPKYSFTDAPQPDILVVPGGGINGALNNAPTTKWITDISARAQVTMSVCNGAFLLANAGLLDGLTATTTSSRIEQLRTQYPKIHVVDDRRFIDNGKIITTAGLSSGIDGALHVVSRILGNGEAQRVALADEYDWRPKSGFARAALADRRIPDIDLNGIGEWSVDRTEGSTDRWELVLRGSSDLSAAQLTDRIGGELERKGNWTKINAAAAAGSSPSRTGWKFKGPDGKAWTANLTIESVTGAKKDYTATLTVARIS